MKARQRERNRNRKVLRELKRIRARTRALSLAEQAVVVMAEHFVEVFGRALERIRKLKKEGK